MWVRGKYLIATRFGPMEERGKAYKGLLLHGHIRPSPKGRRPGSWNLTHLGSGHRLSTLHGDIATVEAVAAEIADLGDWDFDGIDGWRNVFPDMQERFSEIEAKYPKVIERAAGAGSCPDVAREIAMARA